MTVFEGDEISFLLLLYADVNGSISARHVNFRPLDLISLKPTKEKTTSALVLRAGLDGSDGVPVHSPPKRKHTQEPPPLRECARRCTTRPVVWFSKRLEYGENEFESLIQTSDRSVPHVLKRPFILITQQL